MVCIPINLIGVLYTIFILKEVKPKIQGPPADISPSPSPRPTVLINSGDVNPTYEQSNSDDPHAYNMNGRGRRSTIHVIKEKIEKNWFVQFFNPIVAVDCFRVILRERKHNQRRVVILLLVMYFFSVGPAFGK